MNFGKLRRYGAPATIRDDSPRYLAERDGRQGGLWESKTRPRGRVLLATRKAKR
jgi:hypothetical protein